MNKTASKSLRQDPADKAQWLRTRPGEYCLIRECSEDTNGLYAVLEIVSSPGDGTPLHLHSKEDEHFLVLEGSVRIAYGDKIFDLQAGEVASLRRGIPHAWGNRTKADLRMVILVSPGGCEEALRILAGNNDVDLRALGEPFHIELLGPTPF
ncbi:MAG TPA: cupin domain-containing protein [Bryobacteraceae bacterium]|nr:cupin domain-containing protein [Bryobacteraceae bacterium]